jgi:dienelactone hydrolase
MWWIAGAAGLVLLLVLGNTARNALGLSATRMSPDALSAMLAPGYDIRVPDGATGLVPTALLFSGCDGVRDNMGRWADALNAAGWAAVIVDSHGPRGYDDLDLWRLVCAGQLLSGAERASDVAVALRDARAMAFADPDRIALIGASHGGWAVLDFLALHGRGERPPLLRRWPAGMRGGDAPPGVVAALVLYPYCGALSLAARWGWQADLPVMMLLVDGDTITNESACLALARRMQAAGRPVATQVFPGVTHGFDQAEKAPFSTLGHDPAATQQAIAMGLEFLDAAASR